MDVGQFHRHGKWLAGRDGGDVCFEADRKILGVWGVQKSCDTISCIEKEQASGEDEEAGESRSHMVEKSNRREVYSQRNGAAINGKRRADCLLAINCVEEVNNFALGKHAGAEYIQDQRDANAMFWISESDAPACAWMPERTERWTVVAA